MDMRTTCPISRHSTMKTADTFRLSRNAINNTDTNKLQYVQTFIQLFFSVYACSYHFFRSKILQLIFITYLDPHVVFQADLWRGHASVLRSDNVCLRQTTDKHTDTIRKRLYWMLHSKICSEIYGSNHREAATEACDNATQSAQKYLEQDTICIWFRIILRFHKNI